MTKPSLAGSPAATPRLNGNSRKIPPSARRIAGAARPARVAPARKWRRLNMAGPPSPRSEEHTSELQSLMRISYAVFCLKQKNTESTVNRQQDFWLKQRQRERIAPTRREQHTNEHQSLKRKSYS